MPYFEFVVGCFSPNFIATTVLIAVCVLTPQTGAAQITFGSPVDYAVDSGPDPWPRETLTMMANWIWPSRTVLATISAFYWATPMALSSLR